MGRRIESEPLPARALGRTLLQPEPSGQGEMIGVMRMASATRATLATAFLSALLVAGCTADSAKPESCPDVLIMPELNSIALFPPGAEHKMCLLYTSDAADDLLCVDLG